MLDPSADSTLQMSGRSVLGVKSVSSSLIALIPTRRSSPGRCSYQRICRSLSMTSWTSIVQGSNWSLSFEMPAVHGTHLLSDEKHRGPGISVQRLAFLCQGCHGICMARMAHSLGWRVQNPAAQC